MNDWQFNITDNLKHTLPYQASSLDIFVLFSNKTPWRYGAMRDIIQINTHCYSCGTKKIHLCCILQTNKLFITFSILSSLKIVTAFSRNLTYNNMFIYLLVAIDAELSSFYCKRYNYNYMYIYKYPASLCPIKPKRR